MSKNCFGFQFGADTGACQGKIVLDRVCWLQLSEKFGDLKGALQVGLPAGCKAKPAADAVHMDIQGNN